MIAKVEDEVRKQAEELLERVGMQDYENSYPRELSGGQKQRVAIVRAMAMNPKILLLDEITASLDPEMVRGVQEIIEHLSNRDHMTMIVVTHQINFAENIADEVLFLSAMECAVCLFKRTCVVGWVGNAVNVVKLWLGVHRLQDNHPLPACVRLTS